MSENEISLETLSDEELAAQIDAEAASERPETVEDTIYRSIEELENGGTEADQDLQGDQGKEAGKDKVSASEAARILSQSRKGPKRKTVEAKDLEQEGKIGQPQEQATQEELRAPQAWDLTAKEQFAKLPEVAKKETLAFWSRLDKHFTNGSQEIARAKQKFGGLETVEQTYQHHLDRHGIDFVSGTRALWATHQEIAQDRMAGLSKLLRQNGVTPEDLYRYQQGQPAQQQFQAQQQNPPLTQGEIDRIVQAKLESSLQQREQLHAVHSDAEQLEQLRNAVGPDGRHLYPELWDNQNFEANYWNSTTIERVKPLVEAARKTQPGLSIAEATKRAINTLRVLDGNAIGSPSPTGPRLPTNQNDIARARAASVSIRSRGNHEIPTQGRASAGESVEQSIARAIAELGGTGR